MRQLLDADREYLVQLFAIEERAYDGPPRYNQQGKQITGSDYIWKFAVWDDESLEPIVQDNGLTYALHSKTSDSTFYDPRDVMTARARSHMHALAGRVLTDDEVDEMLDTDSGIPEECLGQYAIAEMRSYKDNNGNDRVGLGRLRPLKPKQAQKVREALGEGVMEAPPVQNRQQRPQQAAQTAPAPRQPRLPTEPAPASVAPPVQRRGILAEDDEQPSANGTDPDEAAVGTVDDEDIPF
jgi:hypothetical protein